MTAEEILALQHQLQVTGETDRLEAKSAAAGTPKRGLREAISAFANSDGGGTILLELMKEPTSDSRRSGYPATHR